MNNPHNNYTNRLKLYTNLIKEQNSSIKTIEYLRLLTLIIGISITIYTFNINNHLISIVIFIISLTIFIYLVNQHNKEIKKRKYSSALKDINQSSLKRLKSQWKNFKDDGNEFKCKEHPYSEDLDIFGENSLFQWINTCKTFMGRECLKNRLLNPLKTSSDIIMVQESLQELAADLKWRQLFQSEAMVIPSELINPEELYKWGEERNELYIKKWFVLIIKLLPLVTLVSMILSYTTSLIDLRLPYIMLLIQILLLFIDVKKRNITFKNLYKHKNNITVYFKMLTLIEKKFFKSRYLKQLKANLLTSKNTSSVKSIKKLSSIYNKVSDRKNMLSIILNILFLWDYQCMVQLEKWRIEAGKNLKNWFTTIGEFEALNSISNIVYDNPDWTMPSISDGTYVINAMEIGHPLLNNTKVCNNITIDNKKNILLITGSNMSGKSTFLRTIGLNLVLSYIGSPVCAKKFQCSLMKIFTCMRIRDDLENNISSFYAEILRIKMIVENTKKSSKVFFLLDELFKGTNSIDRHLGAKALIKQLGDQGASGLISTHDLELCSLEQEYPRIKNYHFREYYLNNKLKFDYKIRNGASTTRNAKYLIKLAGIDIE